MPTHERAKSRVFVWIPTIARAFATAECSRYDAVAALRRVEPPRDFRSASRFLDIDGDRHIFMEQAGPIARDEGIR